MLVALKQAKKNKDKQADSEDGKINEDPSLVALEEAVSSKPTGNRDEKQAKEVVSKVLEKENK